MTDKNLTPDGEEPEAQTRETTEKPAKPPMSKASFAAEQTPAGPAQAKTEAEVQTEVKTDGRANGRTAADALSMEREALLQVDSYAEAEALLSERPDLIEQARVLFGAIVPTTGQNEFIDLAIRAVAEDDAMSLGDALRAKRDNHLNLTAPEVGQLLEFAQENMGKFPLLALYIALLLTDDLTRLEEAGLWQQQKTIILSTEQDLDLDAMALWEEISAPEPKVEPVAVEPEPIKAEAVAAPPEEKKRPAPPPPPVKVRPRKKVKGAGPPRWIVASGFIFLLTMMSCGACALSQLF
jgi:hypothetical protein